MLVNGRLLEQLHEFLARAEGVGHYCLLAGGDGVEVVQLLGQDGAQLGGETLVGGGVAGQEVGLGYAVHELHILQGGEGELGKGLVECAARVGVPAEGGEVVGQEQHIFPILLNELASGLVDVDLFHGVPCHAVKMAEEGLDGHAVAGLWHEAVGVALQLQPVGVVLAQVVVGVVPRARLSSKRAAKRALPIRPMFSTRMSVRKPST